MLYRVFVENKTPCLTDNYILAQQIAEKGGGTIEKCSDGQDVFMDFGGMYINKYMSLYVNNSMSISIPICQWPTFHGEFWQKYAYFDIPDWYELNGIHFNLCLTQEQMKAFRFYLSANKEEYDLKYDEWINYIEEQTS